MGEQHLNLLCYARGEYANNECSSECRIHRGIFTAKQSQPHERLVSWRDVGKPELIGLLPHRSSEGRNYFALGDSTDMGEMKLTAGTGLYGGPEKRRRTGGSPFVQLTLTQQSGGGETKNPGRGS